MKSPRERLPYSPIVDRPPLKLPGGARMVGLDNHERGALGFNRSPTTYYITAAYGQTPCYPMYPTGPGTSMGIGLVFGVCATYLTSMALHLPWL